MEVSHELIDNKRAEKPSLVYLGILYCCTVDTNSPLKQTANRGTKMLFALVELLDFNQEQAVLVQFQAAVFTRGVLWFLRFINC